MASETILTLLKSNIQMASYAYDEYLSSLIEISEKMIAEHGIELDETDIKDCNLVVMYASYLWSKRQSDNSAMPRMLQFALNNRLFSQKMGGDA